MNLDWGDHRKARWTRLCAAILGDEDRALALTALLNLDARYSTREGAIPDGVLQLGWRKRIRPLLREVRPRIVCALTNRVWDTIVSSLDGTAREIDCPFDLARRPMAFRLPGCGFTTIVVKPHNHPSRFLRNEEIAELGRACQWLIEEVA